MTATDVRIEFVPADSAGETAAPILSQAWPPPSLRYTPEYLDWQLQFPGRRGALATVALVDGSPVGFAGTTPRQVQFQGTLYEVHVVSFVAVVPRYWGQGVATRLYEDLLQRLRGDDMTVITFAQAASPAERLLLRAYSSAGYTVASLAQHCVYGFRAASTDTTDDIARNTSPPQLEGSGTDSGGDDVIWSIPDRRQRRHLELDPRDHVFLSPRHAVTWWAKAIRAEIVTQSGFEDQLSLEEFVCAVPDTGSLRMALTAACHWTRPDLHLVTASNLAPFAESALKDAGLRRSASKFSAFVCCPSPSHALLRAKATSLCVV